MVKKVDDFAPDHIGWRLWDAAAVWKLAFEKEMIAAGHDWYAEARSSIVPYVSPGGTRQSEIVARMGLSKQAVQQLIKDLEAAGIVRREADPDDARGRIVKFTEAGLQANRDSIEAKRVVEARMRARLGDAEFERLYEILKKIGSSA